ncbi:MAG: chemoreceptor glutamine deamidase CheD [Gammaproteobacteria bacterium]|nr:chemoreceptor glutamine deamidase CheD [Gammaproteobacteria bacterium]
MSQEHTLPKAIRGFSGINRYWDKYVNMPTAKILPGEYYVTYHEEAIVTVLGSCVSACVRDRKFNIGGMNHFMLPQQNKYVDNDVLADSNRYGNFAMENMINEILKNGGRRQNLEVKIFGGGKILASMTDIGHRNIQFVHEYIQEEALDLVAEDTGDIYPRKVMYFPYTGKVKVKRLRSLHNNTIVEREMTYMHDIEDKPVAGEIELF